MLWVKWASSSSSHRQCHYIWKVISVLTFSKFKVIKMEWQTDGWRILTSSTHTHFTNFCLYLLLIVLLLCLYLLISSSTWSLSAERVTTTGCDVTTGGVSCFCSAHPPGEDTVSEVCTGEQACFFGEPLQQLQTGKQHMRLFLSWKKGSCLCLFQISVWLKDERTGCILYADKNKFMMKQSERDKRTGTERTVDKK